MFAYQRRSVLSDLFHVIHARCPFNINLSNVKIIFAENSICYCANMCTVNIWLIGWTAEGAVGREAGCYLMKYNMTEIDWLKYGTLMEHIPVDAGAKESWSCCWGQGRLNRNWDFILWKTNFLVYTRYNRWWWCCWRMNMLTKNVIKKVEHSRRTTNLNSNCKYTDSRPCILFSCDI